MKMRKLLLSSLFALSFSFLLTSCNDSKEGKVEYIPVQVSEGGSWAFINNKGERIGTQSWEFMPSVTIDGIFTARDDKGLTVYSWDGDVAKPIDSLQNLVSVGVYNEGVIPVTPAMQRIRIVDKKGNVKFILDPIDGKEITSCSDRMSEGLLVVTTVDNKAGVVNKKGEVVVHPRFSEISDFSGGYAFAADYNGDYEEGPQYYIIDKDGATIKVNGKFGYGEGDCAGSVSPFEHGFVSVLGPQDEETYDFDNLLISTTGAVTKEDGWVQFLDNGGKIVSSYINDRSTYSWIGPDGNNIMTVSDSATYLSGYGKYVVLQKENTNTIYSVDGKELGKTENASYFIYPGGDFGLISYSYDSDGGNAVYNLFTPEGVQIPGATYCGIGADRAIDMTSGEEEGECSGVWNVTSAYVDISAAASKLVSMITDGVKGKAYYNIGESVSSMLSGESSNYYSLNSTTFSIPTDTTYYLATGAGFTINGTARANQNIVAPTYKTYFQVDYYDYWGIPWGRNMKKQVGVHFNSNAKVVEFDIVMRTNHPSGDTLRDAVGRRLKSKGYTLVTSGNNYDQYSNGYRNVIVYGAANTDGCGALISDSNFNLSDSEKSGLAAKI